MYQTGIAFFETRCGSIVTDEQGLQEQHFTMEEIHDKLAKL